MIRNIDWYSISTDILFPPMPKKNCKKRCKNNKNNLKIQAEFAICNSNLLRVFTAPKFSSLSRYENIAYSTFTSIRYKLEILQWPIFFKSSS